MTEQNDTNVETTETKDPKKFWKSHYLIALLVAGAVGGLDFYWSYSAQQRKAVVEHSEAEAADFSHIKDIPMGAIDAPVTVIEYASYTCSHCVNFANEVFPKLKSDYIDTGKVRFILREVITHPAGLWGTQIARCGGDATYHDTAKEVFARFDDWTGRDARETFEMIRQIGVDNGLTVSQADLCLKDEQEAKAFISRSRALGHQDEIRGTPTFIINGVLTQNGPYEDLKKVLDAAIKEAG